MRHRFTLIDTDTDNQSLLFAISVNPCSSVANYLGQQCLNVGNVENVTEGRAVPRRAGPIIALDLTASFYHHDVQAALVADRYNR